MKPLVETLPSEFDWFGPSRISPRDVSHSERLAIGGELADSRRKIRTSVPSSPGVYGWLDGDRQLIYVGKSKSLRHRLNSYFAVNPSDPKMLRIRRSACEIVWEPIEHELLALLREQELIYRWRPENNSQGQPTRRQPAFVCISNTLAPNVYLAKRLTEKSAQVFGPIMGTGRLGEAVETLNHVFRLRDCPDKTRFEFGSQLRLFDETPRAECIRFELGTCPGPCTGLGSVSQYRESVSRVLRFLAGTEHTTLIELEQQMFLSASKCHFERATVLRNQWESLTWLDRHLSRLRKSQSSVNGVLECPAYRGRKLWVIFRQCRLLATMLEPRSLGQARAALGHLEAALATEFTPSDDFLETQFLLIIASWFRKNAGVIPRLVPLVQSQQNCRHLIERYTRAAS